MWTSRFVNGIAKHPELQTDPTFVDFLEVDGDLPRATSTSALSGAGVLRLFNRMGDSIGKMTYKMDESNPVSTFVSLAVGRNVTYTTSSVHCRSVVVTVARIFRSGYFALKIVPASETRHRGINPSFIRSLLMDEEWMRCGQCWGGCSLFLQCFDTVGWVTGRSSVP